MCATSVKTSRQAYLGKLRQYRQYYKLYSIIQCFPGGVSDKELACQCRRHKRCGLDPWVRKIPWRRKWQPAPVFLPGKSHGQRSLAGYSPRGRKSRTRLREWAHTVTIIASITLSPWMMCWALGRWAQANQQTLQWCKRTPSRFWPGPTLQALLALQAVTIPFQTSAHLKHRSKTPLDPRHWGWKLERGWKDQRQQW